MGASGGVIGYKRLGHDGVGAAGAGKTRGLGETADLNRHLPRALNFVDGMRQVGIADERLVRGVEEDDRPMAPGVLDPGGQLRAGGRGAGGIVGETEVDEVGRLGRRRRHVGIGRRRVEIKDPLVTAVALVTGSSRHDIGVEVDRIHRIGNGDAGVLGEDLLDIAAVALRPVRDEDLVGFDPAAPRLVIVLRNRFAEKRVALVGAVTLEGLAPGHFVRGGMQGGDAHGRERLRDIADSQPDDGTRGIGLLVGGHAARDIGEQVRGLELGVVFVDADHRVWERWNVGELRGGLWRDKPSKGLD